MATTENYSYSKVDTYNQCPFKFKLHYFDGHYCFVGNAATRVGSLIHETEEHIANQLKAGEPVDYIKHKNTIILGMAKIEAEYPKDFFELDKTGKTYKQKIYEYLDTGIYYLEQFMKEHPTYEIVGAEIKFDFDYGTHHFRKGSIDRVFKDNATGEYIIQDIKTWAQPEEQKELATPLQFVIYSLAFSKIYNCNLEDISCQYYLPFCNSQIQVAGTKGFIKRGSDKLDKIFEGIESHDWEPNPSPLCHWCNYSATNPNAPEWAKHLCPFFCHWTKDNHSFNKEHEWDKEDQTKNNALIEAYYRKPFKAQK